MITSSDEKVQKLLNSMPSRTECSNPGGGSNNVHDELLKLMVSCLCGGVKICVQSYQEALEAQRLGAVGVILQVHDKQRRIEGSAFDKSSLSIPCYFKVEDAFTIVESEEDVHRLVHPELVTPVLVQSGSQLLLPKVKAALGSSSYVPVFYAAKTLGEAELEVSKFDGIMLINMPQNENSMHRLWAAQCARKQDLISSLPTFSNKKGVIGVVSLQGDYLLHESRLREAIKYFSVDDQFEVVKVRSADDLSFYQNNDTLKGIVLPGGWSNLQTQLFQISGLDQALTKLYVTRPDCYFLCVCAGWILARSHDGKGCKDRLSLNLFDTVIDNNMLHGRYQIQLEPQKYIEEYTSLQCDDYNNSDVNANNSTTSGSKRDIWGVFSNAPFARQFPLDTTQILARVVDNTDDAQQGNGAVVGMRQGNCFGYAFHDGIHRPFVKEIIAHQSVN